MRAFGATYANYVGKPLSYVLATPARPDDADNPLRIVYGNEGAPGDLARFAGRAGEWLRVDGENLGTAPVERALRRHPAIAEAVVYSVPDPVAGDQVMACIVLRGGASPIALDAEIDARRGA